MDFQSYLQKYGVNYEVKLVHYHNQVYKDRSPNFYGLTLIAHTEGVATKISGKADRSLFPYFNGMMSKPEWERAMTHSYITFSGKFELYQAAENGCWGTGNEFWDTTGFQVETQDNGYYDNPATYTDAQYNTWKRVYCAWKDYCLAKWNRVVKFEYTMEGLVGHNNINPQRACPGALDLQRIIREAKALHEEVNKPPVVIPEWKRNAVDIGTTVRVMEKEVKFINFENGKEVSTVNEGDSVAIRYQYGGYYITPYSYLNTTPVGIKVEDFLYEKPDVFQYWITSKPYAEISDPAFEVIYASEYYDAKSKYDKAKEDVIPRHTRYLYYVNETLGTAELLESYTEPDEILYVVTFVESWKDGTVIPINTKQVSQSKEFKYLMEAIEYFVEIQESIRGGETLFIVKYNVTAVTFETLKRYTKPVTPPVDIVSGIVKIIKGILNFIINLWKNSRKQ